MAPNAYQLHPPRRNLPGRPLSSTAAALSTSPTPHSPNTFSTHLPVARQPQLPVAARPACWSSRHRRVGPAHRPGLAGPDPDRQPDGRRHHDRLPVPADPGARTARRAARRPLPQAHILLGTQAVDGADRRGARAADPQRADRGLARLPARRASSASSLPSTTRCASRSSPRSSRAPSSPTPSAWCPARSRSARWRPGDRWGADEHRRRRLRVRVNALTFAAPSSHALAMIAAAGPRTRRGPHAPDGQRPSGLAASGHAPGIREGLRTPADAHRPVARGHGRGVRLLHDQPAGHAGGVRQERVPLGRERAGPAQRCRRRRRPRAAHSRRRVGAARCACAPSWPRRPVLARRCSSLRRPPTRSRSPCCSSWSARRTSASSPRPSPSSSCATADHLRGRIVGSTCSCSSAAAPSAARSSACSPNTRRAHRPAAGRAGPGRGDGPRRVTSPTRRPCGSASPG